MKNLLITSLLILATVLFTNCSDDLTSEIEVNYQKSNDRKNIELYIIEKDEIGGEEPDDDRRRGEHL